jgi:truncated hemoglobin YjbI
MTKPVPDKAEVAIDYPDKFYIGTFTHASRFDAHLDETGIALTLDQAGEARERKSVKLHLHFGLFAAVLADLAETVARLPAADHAHRAELAEAAEALARALRKDGG